MTSTQQEAAELRELIRDAHGAAKDLRQAVKDARRGLRGDLEASLHAHLEEHAGELAQARRDLQAELDRVAGELQQLTGGSPEELAARVVEFAGRRLADQILAALPDKVQVFTEVAALAVNRMYGQ